jgi:hypothetical protein
LGLAGYSFFFGLLALSFIGCWKIGDMIPENKTEESLRYFGNCMVPALAGMYASAYFIT